MAPWNGPNKRVSRFLCHSRASCRCRRTLHIDFRSDSSTGLIFVLADYDAGDVISAFLHHGHVTFARRCSNGRAYETYHQRLDDMRWHSVCVL